MGSRRIPATSSYFKDLQFWDLYTITTVIRMQPNKKEVKKAATTASKAKANATANDLTQDVRPYDILCGRSKTCFNNIGNRRFRITIGMNVKKYDLLANRTERGKFIVELSRTLREEAGYRFFRVSKKNGKVELSDDEIRAKIGHALRDLSITQANAAEAAAAKSVTSYEETKKFTPTIKSEAKVVSPDAQVRRVTNDFHTDSNGMLMPIPQCPDLQKDAIIDSSETSQEIPKNIYFSPQQDLLPGSEVAPQSPKILFIESNFTTEQETSIGKPIPIEQDSSSESSVHKDKEVACDDYHLMPLNFDEHDDHDTDMLEPIPLDMLPEYYADSFNKNPFYMDHGEDNDNSEEICNKIRKMQGFPSFASRKHETMSAGSADDHMITSDDAVGYLAMDVSILA
ncbi:unnamed protein product [Cylindrotheca closterium]|uniref:DUF6824 domain-containing protein n=1 Tax=Cylindrotheca closterium TaxID=2856 RepID=A0AAD2CP50_9STRA|nr:unnamed protein product [Cylindrotheca closterium]